MSAQHTTAERIGFATAVYERYAQLLREDREELGGQLLLVAGSAAPDPISIAAPSEDEALIRAANIAGAATLLLCPSSRVARAWVHAGVCDFLVTTLDEALRILKNELRRKLPAAVCLLADSAETMRACVERGVQPDLLAPLDPQIAESSLPESRVLFERGARLLESALGGGSDGIAGNADAACSWSLAGWSAAGQETLPALDHLALGVLGAKQHGARRRWLMRAPQYLGRALGRGVATTHTAPMEPHEAAELATAIAAAIREGSIPPGVQLHYAGNDRLRGQPDPVYSS